MSCLKIFLAYTILNLFFLLFFFFSNLHVNAHNMILKGAIMK